MQLLLHPCYFPNIATMACLTQRDIVWEVKDNYQKQTYRNRTYICTDQGKHMLSIPISHVGGSQGRQAYRNVRLDNSYPWQRQHWRTLQTAYRTSPFFEFYEDELAPLYEERFEFLLDFNFKTIDTLCGCLGTVMPRNKTEKYQPILEAFEDGRFLVYAKKEVGFVQNSYVQVFGDRHGFVKNTSTLDLLFNEGTNALSYLKEIKIDFLNA